VIVKKEKDDLWETTKPKNGRGCSDGGGNDDLRAGRKKGETRKHGKNNVG